MTSFRKYLFKTHTDRTHRLALRLVLLYAIISCLWILFSDKAVEAIATSAKEAARLSTLKGFGFIIVTSIFLYGLVRGYLSRLAKAHTELLDSEETLKIAFDKSPEAITISRLADGVYIDVNQSFTQLTGYAHDEVIGKAIVDVHIWEPADRARLLNELSHSKEVRGLEANLRSKNGAVKPTMISAAVVTIRGEKCVIATAKDITDRKRVQEATERFTRELDNKNKELQSIIYVASHDLRSALVNIQGFSSELQMACDAIRSQLSDPGMPADFKAAIRRQLDQELPEALEYIVSNTTKIDSLLTGLLQVSRLGREPLNPVEINTAKLVETVLSRLNVEIEQSKAQIIVGPLPDCRGDEDKITQVFLHLVKNAIHYLDGSRRGIINISGSLDGSTASYCVEDNGIGIAPEYQDKIFEIFHRLNPNQSTGEGLGLTVVRLIIERHQGRVWVESEPGKGSCFCVTLPRAD
jgi:PAS domain S-box-containing protein